MAEIPIIDRERNRVARVEWTGGISRGNGVLRSDREHQEEIRIIRQTMSSRKDLENIRFRARNANGFAYGWNGFEGTLQALNIALPVIGYYVDWDKIDWPEGTELLDSEILE